MGLEDYRMIDLPKINDTRETLAFIESNRHVPFLIKSEYVYLPTFRTWIWKIWRISGKLGA